MDFLLQKFRLHFFSKCLMVNFSRETYWLGKLQRDFGVDTVAAQTLQGTNNYSLVWTTQPIHLNHLVS